MQTPPIFSTEEEFVGLVVDKCRPHSQGELELDIIEDVYESEFQKKEHLNFVGKENATNYFVVSVLTESYPFLALKTTNKDYIRFQIDTPLSTTLREESIYHFLNKKFPNSSFSLVSEKNFPSKLAMVEQKHPQKRSTMKIGIVYCKEGQKTGQEMFSNTKKDCGFGFWEYINSLGQKFDLEGWTRYRGDMRPPGTAWFGEWNNIEIVFHIAPILNAEEKRRLIGNDIAMIYYFDAPLTSTFSLSGIGTFGEVPQCFAVVQPNPNQSHEYRIGFFSKINIVNHLPEVPNNKQFFSINEAKNLVLTKLYNGLVKTSQCPPMNRLYMIPRRALLNEICELPTWVNGDWITESDPRWVLETQIPQCTLCKLVFTLLKRKHHCRKCGIVICSGCSTHMVEMKKVCESCWGLYNAFQQVHSWVKSATLLSNNSNGSMTGTPRQRRVGILGGNACPVRPQSSAPSLDNIRRKSTMVLGTSLFKKEFLVDGNLNLRSESIRQKTVPQRWKLLSNLSDQLREKQKSELIVNRVSSEVQPRIVISKSLNEISSPKEVSSPREKMNPSVPVRNSSLVGPDGGNNGNNSNNSNSSNNLKNSSNSSNFTFQRSSTTSTISSKKTDSTTIMGISKQDSPRSTTELPSKSELSVRRTPNTDSPPPRPLSSIMSKFTSLSIQDNSSSTSSSSNSNINCNNNSNNNSSNNNSNNNNSSNNNAPQRPSNTPSSVRPLQLPSSIQSSSTHLQSNSGNSNKATLSSQPTRPDQSLPSNQSSTLSLSQPNRNTLTTSSGSLSTSSDSSSFQSSQGLSIGTNQDTSSTSPPQRPRTNTSNIPPNLKRKEKTPKVDIQISPPVFLSKNQISKLSSSQLQILKEIEGSEIFSAVPPIKMETNKTKTTLNEEHFANLQVNQLFSKPDASHSILDVLLIENIEVAVTNPKNLLLLQFLTSTEQIKEILIFFELDSQLTSSPKYDNLYPIPLRRICRKLLQVPQILLAILVSVNNLRLFFGLFKKQQTSSRLFSRLVQILMSFSVLNEQLLLNFILENEIDTFFDTIFSKIGTENGLEDDVSMSIMIILKAVTYSNLADQSEARNWIIQQDMPNRLFNYLNPKVSSVTQESAVYIASEFLYDIHYLLEQPEINESAKNINFLGDLVRQYKEVHTLKNTFAYFSESKGSLINGLKLFESILETEEECGASMLSIFDENIDFFLDSLFQQKSNNKVFGIERLMILKFILALVNSQPGVTNFLAEKEFYSKIFDFILGFPKNNILHDIILSFFILLFEQDDTDVVIQIFNSGLLESIGNVWVNRSRKLVEKKENLMNQYDCYFGHVATLSNMILYYSIAKPTIALTDRKEYKELIEANIDAYNLTHPRPLFQKER